MLSGRRRAIEFFTLYLVIAVIVGLGPATIALLRWTHGHPDRVGLIPFAGFGAGVLTLMLLVAVVKAGSPLSDDSGASFDTSKAGLVSTPTTPAPAEETAASATEPAPTETPAAAETMPEVVPVGEAGTPEPESLEKSPPDFDELVKDVWERVDRPVAEGVVDRPWIWGAEPLTEPVRELYEDSPGGDRLVQYFDHARLEVTNPSKSSDSAWRLTPGLLVWEMIKGRVQVGIDKDLAHAPAELDIIGEGGDSPTVPNYAALAPLRDVDPLAPGDPIIWRLDGSGEVTSEPVLGMRGIDVAVVDEVTDHAIARPFWEYMTATGIVWDGEEFVEESLFRDPFFATGHPVTEPYWIVRDDGGVTRDVLVQCFERRCLIYGPEQGAEWRVTSNLAGRHYLTWRYGDQGIVASSPLIR